ncbi:MAG: DNA recombination protein RmuC [Firmicutes bacterium]|nr:DNA recombination protein RmuC [Bacillota bacterium]
MSNNVIIIVCMIISFLVFVGITIILQLNTRKTIRALSSSLVKAQMQNEELQNARNAEHNVRMQELGNQFNRTMSQINKSLGEMDSLASGVDDLRRLMLNVKSRGIIGELQLGAILAEMLAPSQYEENVAVKATSERVEYAVKFPGESGNSIYLPIDSKFPGDAYLNLLDAYDSGNRDEVKMQMDILRRAIIKAAKDIKNKYVYPPLTTDFAIMFLPFEGLYAEVLRMNIADSLQREYRVVIAGPTTLAAILSSFQVGFRSLALQESSGEVWETLERTRTEFDKFQEVLNRIQVRMDQTQSELETLVGVRTRGIQKALKNVYEKSGQEND